MVNNGDGKYSVHAIGAKRQGKSICSQNKAVLLVSDGDQLLAQVAANLGWSSSFIKSKNDFKITKSLENVELP
jgi:hypothetical protein